MAARPQDTFERTFKVCFEVHRFYSTCNTNYFMLFTIAPPLTLTTLPTASNIEGESSNHEDVTKTVANFLNRLTSIRIKLIVTMSSETPQTYYKQKNLRKKYSNIKIYINRF